MAEPQSYKNHTRLDPLWHYFILPMLLLNIILAIVAVVRHWPDHEHLYTWWVVMAVVGFLAVGKARGHSLVAQDRVIRLEERLRFAALLSPEQRARAEALTVQQIIALRFAADSELPGLVDRVLIQNLTPKQIKESINSWRPDYLRV